MKTIWKIAMGIGVGPWAHELPAKSQFLDVQMQHGLVTMWFLVDPNTPDKETRKFRIFGTGHGIEQNTDELMHMGTVQQDQFVWHIFEECDDDN